MSSLPPPLQRRALLGSAATCAGCSPATVRITRSGDTRTAAGRRRAGERLRAGDAGDAGDPRFG